MLATIIYPSSFLPFMHMETKPVSPDTPVEAESPTPQTTTFSSGKYTVYFVSSSNADMTPPDTSPLIIWSDAPVHPAILVADPGDPTKETPSSPLKLPRREAYYVVTMGHILGIYWT